MMAKSHITVDPLCQDLRAISMTAYMERCMGFNNAKTLAYMAAGLAHIADLMLAQKWREAEDLTLALFTAVDQATINDGKWFYAWQITHLPEPMDTALARKAQRDPLRPYSRLLPPRLSAAITTFSTEGARTAELMKKL